MSNGFTPTQERIVRVLADGRGHKREELMRCLDDPMATKQDLYQRISDLRRKLLNRNLDVVFVCEGRRRFYRLVRPVDLTVTVSDLPYPVGYL